MNTENSKLNIPIIPDDLVQKAVEDLYTQGFELGKVYSNPYARAFKFQEDDESPINKKLRESNH
jgi:hypothetical protein